MESHSRKLVGRRGKRQAGNAFGANGNGRPRDRRERPGRRRLGPAARYSGIPAEIQFLMTVASPGLRNCPIELSM
jgi:hypothetical protein